jgi:Ca-activated chloride channel family protein
VPKPVERSGRDVVFVLDVSRSMLSQDLRPNRLERAKLAVRDVLEVVRGDRTGLVAFAGTAVVKCPLTTDYTFTRMALDELTPDSVSRGGTAIGDGIRAAISLMYPEQRTTSDGRSRTIFLITDGEDHESDPEAAADMAGKLGVRIVTIGLGSEVVGAPVPAAADERGRTPGTLKYSGKVVESRLNASVLKKVAEATPGGLFLNVGTGNVELDRVYAHVMRTQAAAAIGEDQPMVYTELFQWALAAALALLCIEGGLRAFSR